MLDFLRENLSAHFTIKENWGEGVNHSNPHFRQWIRRLCSFVNVHRWREEILPFFASMAHWILLCWYSQSSPIGHWFFSQCMQTPVEKPNMLNDGCQSCRWLWMLEVKRQLSQLLPTNLWSSFQAARKLPRGLACRVCTCHSTIHCKCQKLYSQERLNLICHRILHRHFGFPRALDSPDHLYCSRFFHAHHPYTHDLQPCPGDLHDQTLMGQVLAPIWTHLLFGLGNVSLKSFMAWANTCRYR